MSKNIIKNTKVEGQAKDAGQKAKGSVKNILKGTANKKKPVLGKDISRAPNLSKKRPASRKKRWIWTLKKLK
jgi:hypothetical protein